MDLRLHGIPPSAVERAAVDAVLGLPEPPWGGDGRHALQASRSGEALRAQRHLLLPVLHAVQDRCGWISPGALDYLCQRLAIPPAEAYGVASFYALFSVSPQLPVVAHVCDDLACLMQGAQALCADVERALGPAGVPKPQAQATWHRSPCLGLCDRAPAVLLRVAGAPPGDQTIAPATAMQVRAAGQSHGVVPAASSLVPQAGAPDLHLLRRVGVVDPTSLDAYRAHGGYAALRRALDLGPAGVLREVNESKLLGRGGAAFPTGRKWEAVAQAPVHPHYLICNADESEPGTFKDRELMESDPFAVIEAMTIAAFATGCEKGYLYVRGEYPLARHRIENAIEHARAHGLLEVEIEVRRGAGAYICGEETALFNSIEGKRGEPRSKPPFPVQAGLFGKPTLVNNVETLVNVLDILVDGGAAFAATGTQDSTGTRLFCLSGHVREPGLYEVPMGTTLRALIDVAGGLQEGRKLQAVLLGGAAGSFVTEQQLDVPLSFEGTRAIGATLGSGAVIVLDDTADLKPVLLRIARFFRDESCGQCVPCRVGTVRQEEVLHRMLNGRREESDIT